MTVGQEQYLVRLRVDMSVMLIEAMPSYTVVLDDAAMVSRKDQMLLQ